MRLGDLQTTSIDPTNSGDFRCSLQRAFNDAILNASEPQKRTRNGSRVLLSEYLRTGFLLMIMLPALRCMDLSIIVFHSEMAADVIEFRI